MGQNTQLVKGVMEFGILQFISLAPTYGYEILARMKEVGFHTLTESTLYPLLFRLEQRGDVTVERRSSPNGPSRKYYTITGQGHQALADFHQNWQQLCLSVNLLFAKGDQDEPVP